MRGPKPVYPIELTTEEAKHLQHLIRAHTTPQAQAVRARVTATACSLPCQHHVPLSRWSRTELARRVAQDPSLSRISASTVGRWLKADRLRPWRYHAWQHIHDPVSFLERVRPVLEAYAQARNHELSIHIRLPILVQDFGCWDKRIKSWKPKALFAAFRLELTLLNGFQSLRRSSVV